MIHHQEEILEDILSRLPAKSIGRFRCVSIPWRALLSQPHFIKNHLNRIKQFRFEEQSLFLVTYESKCLFTTQLKNAHHMLDEMATFATKISFDNHQFDTEVLIRNVASYDGLALFEDKERLLLLVNPTTKEFKELPESPYALDPDASSYSMYGVGYDSVSDDYKVVTVFFYINVYSVKNGTWKSAANSPYDHAVGHVTSGVFVDGCIHWLACTTSDYSSVIVAFDLTEEKFRQVPPPSLVEGSNFVFSRLLTLGGCLCMSDSNRDYKTDIWVMTDYGVKESWTRFAIIDTEKSEFRPLCMLGKDQVVLVKNEETTEEKLVMYSLKEGRFKDIVVEGIPHEFGVGGTFIESLVSPHCSVEAITEE
ncbi:hypothetical protein RDABS01_020830 [Bienertia sinuspersici]